MHRSYQIFSRCCRGRTVSRHAPIFSLSQYSADHAGQMDDMAELFHHHQFLNFDCAGLTSAINIVSSQINKHDVLRTILCRIGQLLTERFILCDNVLVTNTTEEEKESPHPLLSFLSVRSPQSHGCTPCFARLYTMFLGWRLQSAPLRSPDRTCRGSG